MAQIIKRMVKFQTQFQSSRNRLQGKKAHKAYIFSKPTRDGATTSSVFLDVSTEAFVSLSHKHLLDKLKTLGIKKHGSIYSWSDEIS